MRLTVAICTWNRAELLDRTLEQLRHVAVPAGVEWELLVVNNNCTDHTDRVIAKHAGCLPVRRVFESTPGLSQARNRAIAEAVGEVLIYLDDDVLVDPEWLNAYAEAAARWPDAQYFAGPVRPDFAAPPPQWVARSADLLRGPLSTCDYGPTERLLAPNEPPIGANMGFRLEAIRGIGFRPELGRTAGQLQSGDDTVAVHQVRAAGGAGVWIPAAHLQHHVPTRRMTAAYVWEWFYWQGISSQRIEGVPDGGRKVFGIPGWILKAFVKSRLKSVARRPGRGRTWVKQLAAAAHYRGLIAGLREAARAARPEPRPAAACRTAVEAV